MGLPRSRYVQEGEEGVYHCFSRCVRRAFLCGFDKVTQRDYSHRKTWLVERLRHLAAIFAIEVCAYAVMDTHYHTVLRTRPDVAGLWSDREVAIRWLRLFPRHRKASSSPAQTEEQIRALTAAPERIEQLRERLCSLSWFMGRLNEFIAREANKEDGVKGRFWESRFKCRALLDEAATACCMTYVDLNLVAAGMAATPEESDFTSIQERIRAWQQENLGSGAVSYAPGTPASLIASAAETAPEFVDAWLCPIESGEGRRGILGMTTVEYFELVDRSARMRRANKLGVIDATLAPILARIGANPDAWIDTVSRFETRFRVAAGSPSTLRKFADRLGRHWLQGVAAARASFLSCSRP